MAKKPTIQAIVSRGFTLARRPEGVLRSHLAAQWKTNIGWKKYLDNAAAEGERVTSKLTDDGVAYFVTAAKAKAKKAARKTRSVR